MNFATQSDKFRAAEILAHLANVGKQTAAQLAETIDCNTVIAYTIVEGLVASGKARRAGRSVGYTLYALAA